VKCKCIGAGRSRYDKEDQHIWIGSAGVEYRPKSRVGLRGEIGIFRNSYKAVNDRRVADCDFIFSLGVFL